MGLNRTRRPEVVIKRSLIIHGLILREGGGIVCFPGWTIVCRGHFPISISTVVNLRGQPFPDIPFVIKGIVALVLIRSIIPRIQNPFRLYGGAGQDPILVLYPRVDLNTRRGRGKFLSILHPCQPRLTLCGRLCFLSSLQRAFHASEVLCRSLAWTLTTS